MHLPGTSVTSGDARLHVQECGTPSGRELLFLHGGAGSLDDWDCMIKRFGAYRCVLVDSRGHGASTRTDAPLSYPVLAADAETVIGAMQLHAPVIIGHSDGGIAALHVAMRGNVPLSGIVTIAAHGAPPRDDIMRNIYAPLDAAKWRARSPEAVASYERLNPAPDFDAFFTWLIAMWRNTAPGNYPAEGAARMSCRALIVGGDEDHLVPREETVELASRVQAAALGIVPFGSHVPHWDQPDLVGGWIDGFLGRLAS